MIVVLQHDKMSNVLQTRSIKLSKKVERDCCSTFFIHLQDNVQECESGSSSDSAFCPIEQHQPTTRSCSRSEVKEKDHISEQKKGGKKIVLK